jgi:hypothetical protein
MAEAGDEADRDALAREERGDYVGALRAIEAPRGGAPYRDPARPPLARRLAHGRLLWRMARFAEADAVLADAHAEAAAAHGAGDPLTLAIVERRAAVAHYRLDGPRAIALFGEVVAGLEDRLGAGHLRVGVAERNLAACLRDEGDGRAAMVLRRATRTIVTAAGRAAPDTVAAHKVEALLLLYSGDVRGAAAVAADAVDAAARVHGADHPLTAAAQLTLARAHLRLRSPREAGPLAERARAIFARSYGRHPLTALALEVRACHEAIAGELEPALATARECDAMYAETYPGLVLSWFGEVGGLLVEHARFEELVALADRLLTRPLDATSREQVLDYRGVAIEWLEHAHDLGARTPD